MLLRRTSLILTPCLLWLASCGGAGDGGSEPTPEAAPPTTPPASDVRPLLVDATGDWNLAFSHDSGAGGELLFPEMMGGGIAVFDADEDGDLDLYFISGAPRLGLEPSPDGPVNQLFLRGEDGLYADATAASGLGDPGYGTGVAVGDVDNDGHEDVFVTNFGPDRLFLGRGDGTFQDATGAVGIAATGDGPEDWSTSAAFCDFDRDGYLDLYVVRYVVYDRSVKCTDMAGRREYCGPDSFVDRTDV